MRATGEVDLLESDSTYRSKIISISFSYTSVLTLLKFLNTQYIIIYCTLNSNKLPKVLCNDLTWHQRLRSTKPALKQVGARASVAIVTDADSQ